MKKNNNAADIPNLFKIKQPKVDDRKVKKSWDAIAERLTQSIIKKDRINH